LLPAYGIDATEGKYYSALNIEDIKCVYDVREKLLEDLSNPPTLEVLAGYAGISLSKLKRLFKQVYGKNVYQYYQDIRMKEAAYLLKHKGLSVSETGYALGFSNMSHFSRVFEEHIGVKPKKYSML
jgi:AraC-like DNA-binding protein